MAEDTNYEHTHGPAIAFDSHGERQFWMAVYAYAVSREHPLQTPAKVADDAVIELRKRERDG